MSDSRADEVLRLHSALANERSNFENLWRELEDFSTFAGSYFQNENQVQGQKSGRRIFDETVVLAKSRYAAACESLITPRTQRYHGLKPADPDLAEDKEVKDFCEAATDLLFTVRYGPRSNFASQMHESYEQTGVYGTGCLFVDDAVGSGIIYRAVHLSEIYLSEDMSGKVDVVHRKFRPTIRQIAQRFGVDSLPPKYRDMLDKQPETRLDVLHAVMPNDDLRPDRKDFRGMPIRSHYVLCEGRAILDEGGYRTMPYAIGRHSVMPNETYGRGPGMMALAAIKNLNEMVKTLMRSAQMTVAPPLLMTEDALMRQFDMRSGSLNYGGLDMNGNELVKALRLDGRFDLGEYMVERATKIINDAFLVNLFQILVENPQMTATEAMLRAQEKGQLLAPTMGRIQSEQFSVVVERELDILARAGALPPMPDALMEAGGEYAIEFSAPLNKLQRSEDAIGILRTQEALAPMAQIDPNVMDVFDVKEAARVLADVYGAPSRVLRSKKAVEEISEGKREQAEQAAMLQAAPIAASAAKDMAHAQQIARQTPGALPGIGG